MDYQKIFLNGAVGFCAALGASVAVMQTTNYNLAFMCAIIQGALSALLEMQKEIGTNAQAKAQIKLMVF